MTDFEYRSNATIPELAGVLRDARRVCVTSHAKPDGDALGSMLVIARICDALGIESEVWVLGPAEESLLALAGDRPLRRASGEAGGEQPGEDFDLVVVVDTGAWTQLEPLESWLRARRDRTIGFDHHARGDDVAARRVVDVTRGSATLVLLDLVDELGIDLAAGADEHGRFSVAEAIFIGVATDTGWFRFDNADALAFAQVARLLAAGVDKSTIYRLIEETDRPERLAIAARALASLDLGPDGRVAIMRLSQADFRETGARSEELSGLVNDPMRIATVEVSILLTESREGRVKASLRSKPGIAGAAGVDVNQLAARFGGGGHRHAAGARLDGTLDDAAAALRGALDQVSVG